MSTLSTATITAPPNHQYHHQPNKAQYPAAAAMADYTHSSNAPPKTQSNGYATNAAPAEVRRPPPAVVAPAPAAAAASSQRPLPQPPQQQQQQQSAQQQRPSHSQSLSRQSYNGYDAGPPSSAAGSARKRARQDPVDWERYFGGKPPKEIIVIDDDDEQPTHSTAAHNTTQSAVPNPAYSNTHHPSNSINNASSTAHHADKRRKMGTATTAAYDPVYNPNGRQSYSSTQTPYYEPTDSTYTGSIDRTASYNNTTAPTSLSSNGTYLEDGRVGEKRKRSTRQTAADQKKREVAARPDPFSEYIPPTKPLKVAGDVYVPVVHDRVATRHDKIDEDDGHYLVVDGSDLTERYQIVRLLGQGTFGKVVQAWDRKRQSDVAIKIIRSVQKYREASRIELRVLSTLSQNDKQNRNKCIHLRDTFDFRNHICIVTDLLGQSVFDFLKSNNYVPFPSSHIQKFARQLFTSIAFLHDLNLIHTDLKPENILLVNNQYQTFTYNRNIPSSSTSTARSAKFRRVLLDPEIRLIDFGSATFENEYHSSVVSTRHYRAPEIILNLGWSFPCDIWSIGCILVEFFTGDALFQTHDNLEHLAMMEAVCDGPLDKPLIRQVTGSRGKNSATQYFKRQTLDYPQTDTPRSSKKFVRAMKHLHETIPPLNDFNRKFLDLLKKIFVYDPKKRITAHQALKHEWFREHFEDDGTEAEKIKFERDRAERLRRAPAGAR